MTESVSPPRGRPSFRQHLGPDGADVHPIGAEITCRSGGQPFRTSKEEDVVL